MYPMFTQISHIHSHLLRLIAEATPRCFCLVFTTRGVSEMELGGEETVSITMSVLHKMIHSEVGKQKIAREIICVGVMNMFVQSLSYLCDCT